MRPRLLDLFCGAGGAAMGYHRAGFDIIGVDINPQPRYPFEFVQADAITFALDCDWSQVQAVHASPPCKGFTKLAALAKVDHPDLLTPIRTILAGTGLPYIIENVPGAPLRADFALCGCTFALPRLRRMRYFETNWSGPQMRTPCHHEGTAVTVAGRPGGWSNRGQVQFPSLDDWKRAMDIDWMSSRELSQAIPPAYTEHIGAQLLAALAVPA